MTEHKTNKNSELVKLINSEVKYKPISEMQNSLNIKSSKSYENFNESIYRIIKLVDGYYKPFSSVSVDKNVFGLIKDKLLTVMKLHELYVITRWQPILSRHSEHIINCDEQFFINIDYDKEIDEIEDKNVSESEKNNLRTLVKSIKGLYATCDNETKVKVWQYLRIALYSSILYIKEFPSSK